MPLSGHPPRRSQRAALSHWAPALSRNDQALYYFSYPHKRMLQPFPVLSPATGLLLKIALGQIPFLHRLRHRAFTPDFVRWLLRYYGFVRLPPLVHRRFTPLGFSARATPLASVADGRISRFPCEKLPCMLWFLDRARAEQRLL